MLFAFWLWLLNLSCQLDRSWRYLREGLVKMGRLSSRVGTYLGWGPNRRKSREKEVLHLPACPSLLVRALVLLLLLLLLRIQMRMRMLLQIQMQIRMQMLLLPPPPLFANPGTEPLLPSNLNYRPKMLQESSCLWVSCWNFLQRQWVLRTEKPLASPFCGTWTAIVRLTSTCQINQSSDPQHISTQLFQLLWKTLPNTLALPFLWVLSSLSLPWSHGASY